MATKKQQRRKYQRAVGRGRLHEGYEPKPGEETPAKDRDRASEAKPVMVGAREVKPPSYLRSAKRAAVMAVALFAAIQFIPLSSETPSPGAAALQAAVFFCWLTPFGYFLDLFLYRRALKRQRQG